MRAGPVPLLITRFPGRLASGLLALLLGAALAAALVAPAGGG